MTIRLIALILAIGSNLISFSLAAGSFKKTKDSSCQVLLELVSQNLQEVNFERIPVGNTSFASEIQNYEEKIMNLERNLPDLVSFSKKFYQKNERLPSNRDLLNYIAQMNHNMLESIQRFRVKEHDHLNQIVEDFYHQLSYSGHKEKELVSLLKSSSKELDQLVDVTDEAQLKFINSYLNSFEGAVGEFDILMRLNDFYVHRVQMGLVKKESKTESVSNLRRYQIEKMFGKKIDQFFGRMTITNKSDYLKFERKYPNIFQEKYFNMFGTKRIDELLHFIKMRILSKEIDIVLKNPDGTLVFFEVKNFKYPIKRSEILKQKKKGSNRSIFSQQMLMKEILELLGLSKEVGFGIVFRHGIMSSAAELLEEQGVRVIGIRHASQP